MAADTSLLASSILTLKDSFGSVVRQAKHDFRGSPSVYDCMEKVGVKTKAELEQLWEQHSNDPQVRGVVKALLEAEEEFAEFIIEADKSLIPQEDVRVINDTAIAGKVLPKDLTLIDAVSGLPSPLESCWKGAKFTLFMLVRHHG